MKNLYLIITMILTLAFLLIPLLATEKRQNEGVFSNSTSIISIESDTQNLRFEKLSEIKLFCVNTKKILPLKVEEYVLGVVAAEMPSEYHIEALKAQALAAYTYAYKKHLEGSEKLNEYDLTNDSTIDQRYADESARKTKWGEKFNENEARIKTAVSEILEEIIVYNDKPILAVYHAISPGKTEKAKNVWGTDYPYLQSENSVGDLLSADFYSEAKFSKEDFTNKLAEVGIEVLSESENLIGEVNKSSSGTVLDIELCGQKVPGTKIREVFGLRSAAFDLIYKSNAFVFTVSGYGHGVGMSQFGANYMAQQGSSYEEIIKTYYRGCEIIHID